MGMNDIKTHNRKEDVNGKSLPYHFFHLTLKLKEENCFEKQEFWKLYNNCNLTKTITLNVINVPDVNFEHVGNTLTLNKHDV